MGGVHINSGVSNKAAYLMTDGGSFNGKTVIGLGITKTAKIYYEAQTHLFTSASDYQDLYNDAAAGLHEPGRDQRHHDAADCQQVKNAVDADRDESAADGCARPPKRPCAPPGRCRPICSSMTLRHLPAAAGPRRRYRVRGMVLPAESESLPGPGLGSDLCDQRRYNMWGDDTDTVSDSVIAHDSPACRYRAENRCTCASITPTRSRRILDGTMYDGSVVEYTTDGSNWQDAGALFTENGYRGTISSSYGNPLGGRQGFGNRSWGYLSSRLSLNSLAGQNVRFRFRIASDSGNGAMGWWIDDVRIYTCAPRRARPTSASPSDWSASNPKPGDPVSFVLTISNGGNAAASQIVITDPVPAQVTNLSYSSTLSVTKVTGPNNYQWNLASLAAGASGTITINGRSVPTCRPTFGWSTPRRSRRRTTATRPTTPAARRSAA